MSSPSGSGSQGAASSRRPGRPGVGSGDTAASTTTLPTTIDAPTDVSALTGAAPPASRVNPATNVGSASSSRLASSPSSSSSMGRQTSSSVGPGGIRPTVSMVPGRGANSSLRAQPRMTFKPVMPQRRRPGAGEPAIKQENSPSSASSTSRSTRGSGERGRGAGRGARGGPAGARGARRDIELVASGPFSLGTGSTSKSDRARQSAASRSGVGGSNGGGGVGGGRGGGISAAAGKWGTGGEGDLDDAEKLKPDPGRMSYRNPDKLREKEEYSDQDDDVEIVDLDDVGTLDELAPRALPRVQEKEKKKKRQEAAATTADHTKGNKKGKGKGKMKVEDGMELDDVKPDPEDEEQREKSALSGQPSRAGTISSGTSTPLHISDQASSSSEVEEEEEEEQKGVDALDLSESEAEELGDDLVDDFVFDPESDREEEGGNRLYLFQFPQLFPKFSVPKVKVSAKNAAQSQGMAGSSPSDLKSSGITSALSSSPPGSGSNSSKPRRSVAFAEGTLGGTPPASSSTSTSNPPLANGHSGIKREAPLSSSSSSDPTESNHHHHLGPEGLIGRLQIYKDGRVEMHFGKIIMEVSGGSQTTFLQDLTLLDPTTRKAVVLGEVYRKFTVSPNVENMLDDMALEEERRERIRSEGGDPFMSSSIKKEDDDEDDDDEDEEEDS